MNVPVDLAADLAVAHVLADQGADVAMSFFGSSDLVAETKDDLSPVTEADRAVERQLRLRLGELRPDDAVLGEELGSSGSSTRTWVLDPIDGTNFFAAERSPDMRAARSGLHSCRPNSTDADQKDGGRGSSPSEAGQHLLNDR